MIPRRALGVDAPQVSAVGYGGMHLSIKDRPPEEQGIRVIQAAVDAGVTFIDTADVYCLDDEDLGHNERLIARALKGRSRGREEVYVGTKGGMRRPQGRWEIDGRPQHLRAACERSLQALGVERIDLYQLHTPDPRVPLVESVGALAELQQEGKLRWVGLSNVSVSEIREAERVVRVTTVQNRLNPFFREALAGGVVEYCTSQGIGFLAYSPIGGGRLNRKLPAHPVLQPMARRLGVTAHALVLAWVLAQSPAIIVIPSARAVEHALDSITAASLILSESDLSAITAAEFSRA
ncbi:MAG TPA: aldo/keto reductase [Gemmatimonadales bacterium]|nr:aldo/keto reductase [Gemmatimonadales bacterium]